MRTASATASIRSRNVAMHPGRSHLGPWLPPSIGPQEPLATAWIHAMEFIDHLVELPRLSWVIMGRRLIDDRATLRMRQAARAIVDGAIMDHDLGLLAWNVRDALETAAWYAAQAIGAGSRDARREFAATHGAAESTALALLTRAHLPVYTLGALYAPFAGSITIEL